MSDNSHNDETPLTPEQQENDFISILGEKNFDKAKYRLDVQKLQNIGMPLDILNPMAYKKDDDNDNDKIRVDYVGCGGRGGACRRMRKGERLAGKRTGPGFPGRAGGFRSALSGRRAGAQGGEGRLRRGESLLALRACGGCRGESRRMVRERRRRMVDDRNGHPVRPVARSGKERLRGGRVCPLAGR